MMLASMIAIVYRPGAQIDHVMGLVAKHLEHQGWRLAGFIQLNEPRPDGSRCDMTLRELRSGERLPISARRGRYARGCMLDVAELVRGVALVSKTLEQQPDLLIVNKFGKIEVGGGGFRAIIAEAIERGVPVLIAVPAANLDAWHAFAGGLAVTHRADELPTDANSLCIRLGLGKNSRLSRREDGCVSVHASFESDEAIMPAAD